MTQRGGMGRMGRMTRPMTEEENAAWRTKVEQARKERETNHVR